MRWGSTRSACASWVGTRRQARAEDQGIETPDPRGPCGSGPGREPTRSAPQAPAPHCAVDLHLGEGPPAHHLPGIEHRADSPPPITPNCLTHPEIHQTSRSAAVTTTASAARAVGARLAWTCQTATRRSLSWGCGAVPPWRRPALLGLPVGVLPMVAGRAGVCRPSWTAGEPCHGVRTRRPPWGRGSAPLGGTPGRDRRRSTDTIRRGGRNAWRGVPHTARSGSESCGPHGG